VEIVFKRIIPDKCYLISSDGNILAVGKLFAMAADDAYDINFDFEQFVVSVNTTEQLGSNKSFVTAENI